MKFWERLPRSARGLAVGLALFATGLLAQQVTTALSLLIDVSGSVDETEFNLQRGGYVAAFNNPAVWAALAANEGGVAVNFIYWSSASEQVVGVDWTVLTDQTSSQAFATAIGNADRPPATDFSGQTAPGNAIDFAVGEFGGLSELGITADRWVIDVSGDGCTNLSFTSREHDEVGVVNWIDPGVRGAGAARDDALAAGVDQINGLSIGDECNATIFDRAAFQGGGPEIPGQDATLDELFAHLDAENEFYLDPDNYVFYGDDPGALEAFYNAEIAGGEDAFVVAVADFDQFEGAVLEKIAVEVAPPEPPEPPTPSVPEPTSLILLGTSLFGLGIASRRRRDDDVE